MNCACPICGKKFYRCKAHQRRCSHNYCSRICQNTTHGLSKTNRYDIYLDAQKRAKKKNFVFDIKVEDIPEIPEICPVLGIKLYRNNTDKHGPIDNSPSLDRIDPSLGYVKGNIMIMSHKANRLKSNATLQEIRNLMKFLETLEVYKNADDTQNKL